MGDHDGCVGEGALDVADGLFFVFIANQATDLEWEKTGGVEMGCGCGCGCGCVIVHVHVNKLESGFHLGEKCCHGS